MTDTTSSDLNAADAAWANESGALAAATDSLQPEFKPLDTHHLATHDAYLRQRYATLIAAMLCTSGPLQPDELRLFTMLLTALGLPDQLANIMSEAMKLDKEDLREILRLLLEHKEELSDCLLMDYLIIARSVAPINESRGRMLSEIIQLLDIPVNTVQANVWWACKALGVGSSISYPKELSLYYSLAKKTVKRIIKDFQAKNVVEKSSVLDLDLFKGDFILSGDTIIEFKFKFKFKYHGESGTSPWWEHNIKKIIDEYVLESVVCKDSGFIAEKNSPPSLTCDNLDSLLEYSYLINPLTKGCGVWTGHLFEKSENE